MKIINENTALPISLILIVLGGVSWLTSIYFAGQSNAAQIAEIKAKSESEFLLVRQKLDEVNARLYRIEAKISQ